MKGDVYKSMLLGRKTPGGRWRIDIHSQFFFRIHVLAMTSFSLPAGRLAVTSGGVRQPTQAPALGRFTAGSGFGHRDKQRG